MTASVTPVDVNARLLKKIAVVGLTVQGMPIGSPGMESPIPQSYDGFAFDRLGPASVYARK